MKKIILFLALITAYTFAFGQSSHELSRRIKEQNKNIEVATKTNFELRQKVDELQAAVLALANNDTTITLNGQDLQVLIDDGTALVKDGKAVYDEAKKSDPKNLWAWLVAIFAAIAKFGGIGFINSLLVRAQKIAAEAKGFVNGKPRFILYVMAGSLVGSVIFEAVNGGGFDWLRIAPVTSYVFLASVGIYELGLRPFQKWRAAKG